MYQVVVLILIHLQGLSAGTTYNFRVYVVDSGGVESNEDVTSATTTYLNPTVSGVAVTDTTNDSITVSVSAAAGTSNMQAYVLFNKEWKLCKFK